MLTSFLLAQLASLDLHTLHAQLVPTTFFLSKDLRMQLVLTNFFLSKDLRTDPHMLPTCFDLVLKKPHAILDYDKCVDVPFHLRLFLLCSLRRQLPSTILGHVRKRKATKEPYTSVTVPNNLNHKVSMEIKMYVADRHCQTYPLPKFLQIVHCTVQTHRTINSICRNRTDNHI